MTSEMTTAERAGSGAFWAVIPAGGAGTRLWPLSRAAQPKFLLALTGDRSLLQATADRLAPLAPPERTLVVCGGAHAPSIARQLPEVPAGNILVEPMPKGSGPAIALAAALIARQDPTAVMGSFAADHDVRHPDAFLAAVATARSAAEAGWLVTIGLTPTSPHTGYGYIERTDEVIPLPDRKHGAPPAYHAARFVEKPDRARAEAFLASGRFCWNASMFLWRVDTLLGELARLQPALAAGIAEIAAAWETPAAEATLARVWPTLPEVTIDHGVMEHADRIAVVPAELGWSDIGDWHGLGELLPVDELGNACTGDVLVVEGRDSVVWSTTGRLVALVGVEGLVVVDTPDALLITERGAAQEVRRAVQRLHDHGRDDLT